MNILLIHQAFVSPREGGGTRHYEFAQHLASKGHRFTVVASDLSYLSGKRTVQTRKIVTEETIDGIKVLRAYTYPALHRGFVWRVFSFVSFMFTSIFAALRAGPVDMVMGTSPPIFQAVSAWLVAFLKRRPFMFEVRDLWPAFAIDMGVLKNPVLIKMSTWLERFLYRRARHIIVNSPAYRDYLMERGVSDHKISLIANGVDPDMFSAKRTGEDIRKNLGLDGKFVVTYAGALGPANDIPTILRAAGHLRNNKEMHFLLVGDGKDRRKLEDMAEHNNLTNITFTGSVSKEAIPDILAASDVCVATLMNIPMFRMTYPNKVFDYMAAAKPTVFCIDGVIREVIEAANGGVFVPPGDDGNLARTVYCLEKDRATAIEMGKSAREYVINNLNRRHQAEQFLKLAIEKLQMPA